MNDGKLPFDSQYVGPSTQSQLTEPAKESGEKKEIISGDEMRLYGTGKPERRIIRAKIT